jgi:hypothetical protein
MASHRYWRASSIATVGGGGLELTEFQLLDGTTRRDAGAVLTSSVAPASGALSALADASSTGSVTWASTAGLRLDWDLGAAAEVNNFMLGAGLDAGKFVLSITLQWSDDGVSYTTLRVGDYLVYPGANQMTRNVRMLPRVRSTGLLNAVNTGPGTLACPLPAYVEIGDLMVVAVGTTSPAGATAPAGFTRRSAAGVGGGSSGISELWTRPVLVEADKNPGSWGNVNNVIAMVLNGGLRAPLFESQNTVATGTANVPSQAVPTLVSAGDARLGVSCAYWPLAFGSGQTDMDIAVQPPWVKRFVATDFLRLGLATIPLASGASMTGTWSTSAVNTGAGWSICAAIFAGEIAIEQHEVFAPIRQPTPTTRLLPPQPVPTQSQIGAWRPLNIGKLRRDFYNPVRGNGTGRLSGTTKDKGTPNVPVSERTVLFRQRDCQVVREVLSAPGTGAYSFDYIDETETYFVVSFDHDGVFRAVLADNLTLANGGLELIV